MKITSAEFVVSADGLAGCPVWPRPEFAFIGRSNVGKSSLINLLTGRRDLARVSGTPGKTQLLNFFLINQQWSLVDMPGYGYAKVGQQDRHDFSQAVKQYLEKRPNLARLFVLIDSRLEPQAIDLSFLSWLAEVEVETALVFTKCDKQSATATRQLIEQFMRTAFGEGAETPPVFASSTTTGDGRSQILGCIGQTLEALKQRK